MENKDIRTRKPSHPGVAFRELVLQHLDQSRIAASYIMGVDTRELNSVIIGKTKVTQEMAEAMGKFSNTSTGSWYNMQLALDEWESDNDR